MRAKSQPIPSHEDTTLCTNELGEFLRQMEEARARVEQRTELRHFKTVVFSVTSRNHAGDDCEELKRLIATLGDECVAHMTQNLPKPDPRTLLGSGKVKELAETVKELQADYVVCDEELSPSQVRNLEAIVRVPVLDRAAVILQIFSRHAKTREARVQVEIAHLEHLLPRLSNAWIAWERQGGGGGSGAAHSRGAGETQLELDARRMRERIQSLRSELEKIRASRRTQRKSRDEALRVALVGYTNAGKTTLMNALTGANLSARDALFETLDSTARVLPHQSGPAVIVGDTVGFIRSLPHGLVASFRSTLEEVTEADLLVHVLDASAADVRQQFEVTNGVLAELGAHELPQLVVFNKRDRISGEVDAGFLEEGQAFEVISAKDPADVQRCCERVLACLRNGFSERTLCVPHARADLVGRIYRTTFVLERSDDENGVLLRVSAPEPVLCGIERDLKEFLAVTGSGPVPRDHEPDVKGEDE